MRKKTKVSQFTGFVNADDGDITVEIQIRITDSRELLASEELSAMGKTVVRGTATSLMTAPYADFGIENIIAGIGEREAKE